MEKNLAEAEKWLLKSGGVKADLALFDLYWELGTEDSYKKMISVVEPHAKTNLGAAKRLSKAYSAGKGVKKDPARAAEIIKQFVPGKKTKSKPE